MVAKVASSGKGSSAGLINYLEKQERGNWFSEDQNGLVASEVTASLDDNRKNLGRDDDKFYQVVLCPSENELVHIGNDKEKLREYTRSAMEQYAANFGKSIESKDLVWYAKIEQERTHSHRDRSVQQQEQNEGEKKEGPQTHVHIIVSRTENLERFQERKQAGEIDRKNPLKLSPATNHRDTDKGAVKGGFNRVAFKEAAEKQFDQQFNYDRSLTETFRYANTMQKGDQAERLAMRQEVRKESEIPKQIKEQRQDVGISL
jgi:hypothetical protein